MFSVYTALSLLALFLAFVYRYIIYPAFQSPLGKLPKAHWTSAISPLWIQRRRKQGREVRTIFEAHQCCGDIVLLGPHEVSVASAEGLRKIYPAMEKDRWYNDEFKNYGRTNLVSMLDHQSHSHQKRMISNTYSKSTIMNSAEMAELSSRIIFEKLLPRLDAAAASGKPIDTVPLGQDASMDFMSAYLFGTSNSTDFLADNDAREAYFTSFRTMFEKRPGHAEGRKHMENLCISMCNKALTYQEEGNNSEGSTRPVVFARLYAQLNDEKSGLPPPEAIAQTASEMLDHMVASHEAGGIVMTYVLYRLSLNPALQSELRKELGALQPPLLYSTRNPSVQSPQRLPPAAHIEALPLLNAVLQETLRLHAVTPSPQPRIVPSDGTTIHGYYIPAGTRISSSAYVLHRHKDAYPEPEDWRPERWMPTSDDSAEQGTPAGTNAMRRFFWAFGSGGRMCIGNHFALQVLKLMIAVIYSNYTTSIVDDEGIEQIEAFVAYPKGRKLILQLHAVKHT